MVFSSDTDQETIKVELLQAEENELREYCKKKGFSDSQTDIFVRNSLNRLQNQDM